jgi:hypothetical protein
MEMLIDLLFIAMVTSSHEFEAVQPPVLARCEPYKGTWVCTPPIPPPPKSATPSWTRKERR